MNTTIKRLLVVGVLATVAMLAYNIYLIWIMADLLILQGFQAPDLAYYIGCIIQNGILIFIVGMITNIAAHEVLRK
jgi:hypothetical protein